MIDSTRRPSRDRRRFGRRYGLSTRFRRARFQADVRRGVVISPMLHFFTASASGDLAARADEEYRPLRTALRPRHFEEWIGCWSGSRSAGLPIGLVDRERERERRVRVGALRRFFDVRCSLLERRPARAVQTRGVLATAAELGVPVRQLVYVGDQPKDVEAAAQAGTQFLGVTYGWGLDPADAHLALAESPAAVARYILDRRGRSKR